MRKTNCTATVERVRELFDYDPGTGLLRRKVTTGTRAIAGNLVSTKPNSSTGYCTVMVDGVLYKQHRVIWLWVFGTFPENFIDHINGIKTDNRICNLRDATNKQNMENRGANKNNTSGHKGVTWNKANEKWRAQIASNGKKVYLGYFTNIEEAAGAYAAGAAKYHSQNPYAKQ